MAQSFSFVVSSRVRSFMPGHLLHFGGITAVCMPTHPPATARRPAKQNFKLLKCQSRSSPVRADSGCPKRQAIACAALRVLAA